MFPHQLTQAFNALTLTNTSFGTHYGEVPLAAVNADLLAARMQSLGLGEMATSNGLSDYDSMIADMASSNGFLDYDAMLAGMGSLGIADIQGLKSLTPGGHNATYPIDLPSSSLPVHQSHTTPIGDFKSFEAFPSIDGGLLSRYKAEGFYYEGEYVVSITNDAFTHLIPEDAFMDFSDTDSGVSSACTHSRPTSCPGEWICPCEITGRFDTASNDSRLVHNTSFSAATNFPLDSPAIWEPSADDVDSWRDILRRAEERPVEWLLPADEGSHSDWSDDANWRPASSRRSKPGAGGKSPKAKVSRRKSPVSRPIEEEPKSKRSLRLKLRVPSPAAQSATRDGGLGKALDDIDATQAPRPRRSSRGRKSAAPYTAVY